MAQNGVNQGLEGWHSVGGEMKGVNHLVAASLEEFARGRQQVAIPHARNAMHLQSMASTWCICIGVAVVSLLRNYLEDSTSGCRWKGG